MELTLPKLQMQLREMIHEEVFNVSRKIQEELIRDISEKTETIIAGEWIQNEINNQITKTIAEIVYNEIQLGTTLYTKIREAVEKNAEKIIKKIK